MLKKIDTWLDVQRFVREAAESVPQEREPAERDERELVPEYDME